MNNKYGVDVNYFKKELKHLSDSLDNRTPEELHRYLMVLANTARPLSDDAVLGEVLKILEAEFFIIENEYILTDDDKEKEMLLEKRELMLVLKEKIFEHFA